MDVTRPGLRATPGQAIEELTRGLGLSEKWLSDALGATPRTLERWRSGETHPQREARERLVFLLRLDDHLKDTFGDRESRLAWLEEPSRYLGGIRPKEAIRVGRADRVEAALEALDSGVFV